jgi:broad specificity phosphatase PhoE
MKEEFPAFQAGKCQLVRHGENPANLNNEFSYKLVDYSLILKGRLQAQQTAEYFRDKNIHIGHLSGEAAQFVRTNLVAQAEE